MVINSNARTVKYFHVGLIIRVKIPAECRAVIIRVVYAIRCKLVVGLIRENGGWREKTVNFFGLAHQNKKNYSHNQSNEGSGWCSFGELASDTSRTGNPVIVCGLVAILQLSHVKSYYNQRCEFNLAKTKIKSIPI